MCRTDRTLRLGERAGAATRAFLLSMVVMGVTGLNGRFYRLPLPRKTAGRSHVRRFPVDGGERGLNSALAMSTVP